MDENDFYSDIFANGYVYESVFREYIDNNFPHLRDSLRYDSEAGMFCVCSNDIRNIDEIAYSLSKKYKNRDLSFDKNINI